MYAANELTDLKANSEKENPYVAPDFPTAIAVQIISTRKELVQNHIQIIVTC